MRRPPVPSPERADSPLVRFYRGDAPDARGRTLDDILAWDDEQLEAVHDYIQWLFPLDEPSRFNRDAPLLTAADRLAFRQPTVAGNLRRALDRMLAFYGFALDRSAATPRIVRSAQWKDRSQEWLHAGNHNLLRLTRMIRSLALLGEVDLATALYAALRQECEGRVSSVTIGTGRRQRTRTLEPSAPLRLCALAPSASSWPGLPAGLARIPPAHAELPLPLGNRRPRRLELALVGPVGAARLERHRSGFRRHARPDHGARDHLPGAGGILRERDVLAGDAVGLPGRITASDGRGALAGRAGGTTPCISTSRTAGLFAAVHSMNA